ncbi:MAG: hypothetical protein ACPIOQ_10440 [Promethearchaeia archaeon]
MHTISRGCSFAHSFYHLAHAGAFANETFVISIEWDRVPASAAGPRYPGFTSICSSNSGSTCSELFEAGYPAIDPSTGKLSIRLSKHKHGTARLLVALAGSSSPAHKLLVTVVPVNDAPFFVPGAAWANGVNVSQSLQKFQVRLPDLITNISTGGWHEGAQTLVFSWIFHLRSDTSPNSGSNRSEFRTSLIAGASVECNGAAACRNGDSATLVLTIAADQWGSGALEIRIRDSGGVQHGGVDSSVVSLNVSVTALNAPPTIRVATQLPCDLASSARECSYPNGSVGTLTLTKGSSCFGEYDWVSESFLLPGEHPGLAVPFDVAVLRTCSDPLNAESRLQSPGEQQSVADMFVLRKFAVVSAGRPSENLDQQVTLSVAIHDAAGILHSANVSNDGTLSVRLAQAPAPILPPLHCWQEHPGRVLGGYLPDYGRCSQKKTQRPFSCLYACTTSLLVSTSARVFAWHTRDSISSHMDTCIQCWVHTGAEQTLV